MEPAEKQPLIPR